MLPIVVAMLRLQQDFEREQGCSGYYLSEPICLTLPGDVPGGYAYTYDERDFSSGYSFYEEGECLLSFSWEEGKLITTWYAVKVENPLFSDDCRGKLILYWNSREVPHEKI